LVVANQTSLGLTFEIAIGTSLEQAVYGLAREQPPEPLPR
jgi:hypothetical protein